MTRDEQIESSDCFRELQLNLYTTLNSNPCADPTYVPTNCLLSLHGETANFHKHHKHGTRAYQNAAHLHCISKQEGFWSHATFFSLFIGFPTAVIDQATQHQALLGHSSWSSLSNSQWLSALVTQKPFTPRASESFSPPLLKTSLGICKALWPSSTKVPGLIPKWCQHRLAAYISAWMWHQHFYCHQCRKPDWSTEASA